MQFLASYLEAYCHQPIPIQRGENPPTNHQLHRIHWHSTGRNGWMGGVAVPHNRPMLWLIFVNAFQIEPWSLASSPSLMQQSCYYSWSMRFIQCGGLNCHQLLRRQSPKTAQVFAQFIPSCWMKTATSPKKNCLLFAFLTKYNF